LSLADVAAEAKHASEVVGTMGVALSVCTLPGQVTSDCLGPKQMELGLGIASYSHTARFSYIT
jgi:triose/dihydroxyacetone kinase / FAD-AMP lyase (cyclizing)